MTNLTWFGHTLPSTYHQQINNMLQILANSARDGNWDQMLAILREKPEFINATRPGGKSLYMPLHQVAYNNAPEAIAQELIALGAWRTCRTLQGELPVDLARQRGHLELVEILEPIFLRHVKKRDLTVMQEYFHAVIRGRAANLVAENQLRLPQLEPLLEIEKQEVWFPIPGMYGGFLYWLEKDGDQPLLICNSWCRVVGGSEQTHEITPRSIELVNDGDDYMSGVTITTHP